MISFVVLVTMGTCFDYVFKKDDKKEPKLSKNDDQSLLECKETGQITENSNYGSLTQSDPIKNRGSDSPKQPVKVNFRHIHLFSQKFQFCYFSDKKKFDIGYFQMFFFKKKSSISSLFEPSKR